MGWKYFVILSNENIYSTGYHADHMFSDITGDCLSPAVAYAFRRIVHQSFAELKNNMFSKESRHVQSLVFISVRFFSS